VEVIICFFQFCTYEFHCGRFIGNFTTPSKPHNIGTHLKGIETSFQMVRLLLKSFHLWMSYITFCNFLKISPVLKWLMTCDQIQPIAIMRLKAQSDHNSYSFLPHRHLCQYSMSFVLHSSGYPIECTHLLPMIVNVSNEIDAVQKLY
jgi:hypothetical protein